MEIISYVNQLKEKGIELWLNKKDELAYRAPKGVINETLLCSLKDRKAEIIAYLKNKEIVKHDEEDRYRAFPLTDMQSAYYSGMQKVYELGGTSCHTYLEIEMPDVDIMRFEKAWHQIIMKHDMLRAIVNQDGTQQILFKVKMPKIEVFRESELKAVRNEMATQCFETSKWPSHLFRITQKKEGVIIHFAVDMLIADFISANIILNDVLRNYAEDKEELKNTVSQITFRDVVADKIKRKNELIHTKKYKDAKNYWLNKIADMPERPMLPTLAGEVDNNNVAFKRYHFKIDEVKWQQIKKWTGEFGLTPSNAVLGAFVEVIRKWSVNKDFGMSITLMDRNKDEMDLVGDFTAVNVLTTRESDATFFEKVRQLQNDLTSDLENDSFSGIEVLRELNRSRNANIIFPVVYTSTIGTIDNREKFAYLYNDQVKTGTGISRTPQVWIDCHVIDNGKNLEINWDVRKYIFKEEVLVKMQNSFKELLNKMGMFESIWHEKEVVRCDLESLDVRNKRNQTDKGIISCMLYEGFLQHLRNTPHVAAIVHNQKTYDYKELGDYVGGIQETLLEKNIGQGDYVAIIMPRGLLQVASILAVSLLGGVFVPLDYTQPVLRQENILNNLMPKAILAYSEENALSKVYNKKVINFAHLSLNMCEVIVDDNNKVSDFAYVIYTSGTTGNPKGVVMTHQATCNTIKDINERFQIKEGSVFLGLSKIAFDLSIYDLFGCFDVGGSLVLPNEESAKNPAHWLDLIETYHVNIWNSVPALFKMYLNEMQEQKDLRNTSIEKVLLSGDVIDRNLPKLAKAHLGNYQMMSLGGATEAAIWSIYYDITDYQSEDAIPYGMPLANQRFYVLDHRLTQCPDYVCGEIVIAGDGLAEKYLNDKELTAEKFVWAEEIQERIYRTGDVGYYMEDGILAITGRVDNQIKINGNRIEVGEIENIISQMPGIKNCAVVPQIYNNQAKRLVAYIEAAGQTEEKVVHKAAKLKEHLLKQGKKYLAEIDKGVFSNWRKCSDLTALADILHCFKKAGLFRERNQSHTASEIHEKIGEKSKYTRSINRMIEVLTREGYLKEKNQCYILTDKADNLANRETLWKEFEAAEKIILYSQKLFDYQKQSGDCILEQVRGEINSLNLFFPKGKTDVALAAYRDNIVNQKLNKIVSFIVNEQISGKKQVEILEIGGGVGGTAIPVIDNLAHHDIKYCFTDVSNFFLNHARENFVAYDFMDYKLFDINKDYCSQGFLPNSYQIIICANVLHNSENIPEVLAKIHELLRDQGILIIIEATQESYALLTSLELKGGLDNFTDERKDNHVIFTEKEKWRQKLRDAGFDVSVVLPEEDDPAADSGQTVFNCIKEVRTSVNEENLKAFIAEKLPFYMIPDTVRIMENLPLNTNDKIDRNQLLKMTQEEVMNKKEKKVKNMKRQDGLNKIEEAVADIWKQVLGVSHIEKTDNFYSVGGDSLLIAQVVTKMKKDIKILEMVSWDKLMKEVLENPTLEGMGKIVSSKAAKKKSMGDSHQRETFVHMYKEAEGKTKKVRAFFHTGTGRLIDYKPMVTEMMETAAKETAIIGYTYGDYEEYMAVPIEQLIKDRGGKYAEHLIGLQAESYELVGYCVGGFLALEAAKILLESGKNVKLIVIDSYLCLHTVSNQLLMEFAYGQSIGIDMSKSPYKIDNMLLHEALTDILRGEHRNIKNSELTGLSGKYQVLGDVFTELLDMSHDERLKALFDSMENPDFNGDSSSKSMLSLLYDIYANTFCAMMNYRPEGIYVGDVLFFNAVGGVRNFCPDTAENIPWEEIVLGELKRVKVPGHHGNVIDPEHYQNLMPYFE